MKFIIIGLLLIFIFHIILILNFKRKKKIYLPIKLNKLLVHQKEYIVNLLEEYLMDNLKHTSDRDYRKESERIRKLIDKIEIDRLNNDDIKELNDILMDLRMNYFGLFTIQ
jgi:cell shape-determining protein MreC